MEKEEYFKAITGDFLKNHEQEIRKHLISLNHDLEVLVGLNFPNDQRNSIFLSLLLNIYGMEILSILMSIMPDIRGEILEKFIDTIRQGLDYYSKKLD